MKPSRDTKYSKELLSAIGDSGHATNAELLVQLRSVFPEVSATTVHRATTRLADRGKVLEAPASKQGCRRFDSTTIPHDHFICSVCDGIRNIDIAADVLPMVSSALGGCKITGKLVIYGTCEKCLNREVTA